ncbi:hypothetical protein [Escherichia coli]|uniref:hypothetical protein n=1 Tax=Escherichia coli TaxID=562 RepID=UPI00128FCAA7|nr:hypothetical protein [Escherichia coli]EGJ7506114.1 hypothetical protein [Escherichia coli]MQK82802.1 hypothetical protein [Escherichia coli]CAD5874834.1 Uncharacterised protein [Escherichia coli]HAW1605238.1 hypothetical protein [Escherichia coli]HAW1607839.1 hypothetical protein [Escherichia coli]
MLYNRVKTYYISSKTDSHLIRYDVIQIDADTFRIKVIDDQQRGVSNPNLLVQIDEFDIKRDDYNKKYQIGSLAVVRTSAPPGFENTIEDELKKHRNTIN